MNNWMHSFFFSLFFFLPPSPSLFTSGLFNVAELSNKSVAARKRGGGESRLIALCELLFFSLSLPLSVSVSRN